MSVGEWFNDRQRSQSIKSLNARYSSMPLKHASRIRIGYT
jgi:hypothetical protein